MAKMIFVCRECDSLYNAKSGTHNICPNCKTPLIETVITSKYWHRLSNSQKELVRPNLSQARYGKHTMFCRDCGTAIMDKAIICPNCGCFAAPLVDQSVSIWLVILSLLFPLFGGIYFFAAIKTRPRCAKICSIVAIISWLTGIGSFIFRFLGAILGII